MFDQVEALRVLNPWTDVDVRARIGTETWATWQNVFKDRGGFGALDIAALLSAATAIIFGDRLSVRSREASNWRLSLPSGRIG
jgi:hypothetical protein